MIKLDVTFVSGEGGFSQEPLTYTQIERNDRFAVYERSRDGRVKDYEVIKIQIQKAGLKIFNKTIEEDTERYPSTSQWGHAAFSYRSKAAALAHFKALSTEQSEETVAEQQKIVLPTHEKFTMKDLMAANPTKTQSNLYVELQKLIKENKVSKAGLHKQEGVGGKPVVLYTVVSAGAV